VDVETLNFQIEALRGMAVALHERSDPNDARVLQAVEELIAEKTLELREIQGGAAGS
jgi:hypothetical protein